MTRTKIRKKEKGKVGDDRAYGILKGLLTLGNIYRHLFLLAQLPPLALSPLNHLSLDKFTFLLNEYMILDVYFLVPMLGSTLPCSQGSDGLRPLFSIVIYVMYHCSLLYVHSPHFINTFTIYFSFDMLGLYPCGI